MKEDKEKKFSSLKCYSVRRDIKRDILLVSVLSTWSSKSLRISCTCRAEIGHVGKELLRLPLSITKDSSHTSPFPSAPWEDNDLHPFRQFHLVSSPQPQSLGHRSSSAVTQLSLDLPSSRDTRIILRATNLILKRNKHNLSLLSFLRSGFRFKTI